MGNYFNLHKMLKIKFVFRVALTYYTILIILVIIIYTYLISYISYIETVSAIAPFNAKFLT